MGKHLVVLLIGLVINRALHARGSPAEQDDKNSLVESSVYSINSHHVGVDEECGQYIKVNGQGLQDTFVLACVSGGTTSITSDAVLVYDNPANSFSLLSDLRATLVVIDSGECNEIRYRTQGGQTSQIKSPMTEAKCKRAQQKIQLEKDKFEKSLSLKKV